MSGYIGTKAVTLSTTAANVGGDSTVGGDLTVDTNTLYVDSTNNRVGVGTASPSNPFQVGTSDLIVDSSGNVGIGTSSPSDSNGFGKALDVSGTTGAALYLRDGTDGDVGIFGQFNNATSINSKQADGIIVMYTGSSNNERLRLDASGNVLVACTSVPTSSVAGVRLSDPNAAAPIISRGSGTTEISMLVFVNGNGSVGQITTNGSSTSYLTSSDCRLKENVTDVTDGITRVKQLEPKRFNFIADPDTTVDGFLAHEAQAVVPEAVTGTHNEVDDDGNAVMQGIDQSKLVPLLTAALKEAITKIETLETEMTSVKARLDALEGN